MANHFQFVRNSLNWIFLRASVSHIVEPVITPETWLVPTREREKPPHRRALLISPVWTFLHLEKPFKTVFDSGRRSTQPQEWIKLQKIKRKSIPVFAPTLLSTPTPVFASTPLSTYNPPGEPWMAYGTRRRCSERSVSPLQLFAAPLAAPPPPDQPPI